VLTNLGGTVETFICGPDAFVEAASVLLQQAGLPPASIRTERFGPTGA
jgi:ferredoxin-NADP reductase